MKYMGRIKGIVMENLWCKIERLRQEMHVTALKKGISHPHVLKVSQRLDEYINEFYKVCLLKNPGQMYAISEEITCIQDKKQSSTSSATILTNTHRPSVKLVQV